MSSRIFPVVLGLLLAGIPPSATSQPVADILSALSLADYRDYVGDLVGLGSRYYSAPGNAQATDYVRDTLAGFGLAVRDHAFDYAGVDLVNVEATLTGRVRPNDIFILGAHFDSIASRTSGDPSATLAPGADDNASGTAGMLEIASVLSRYRFESTIRFIGFNGEELGMIGSERYAQDALAAGERILGMIDLDMIGFPYSDPAVDLDLLGDASLVNLFMSNIASFTGLVGQAWPGEPEWSDHQWFSESQYPGSASVMAIEDPDWVIYGSNPYYHTIEDTADRLDYPFALETSRAAAATLIDLAGIMAVPAPATWLLMPAGLVLGAAARARRPIGSRRGSNAMQRSPSIDDRESRETLRYSENGAVRALSC